MLNYLFVVLLSYFLGSIPFAYIMVKIVKNEDVRDYGSGNVGATNALRVLGWKYAVFVFIFDILKGFTAVFFISRIGDGSPVFKIVAALCVIFGHVFSIFLKFDGGKGAATGLGVVIALSFWGAISGLVIWALTLWRTRISSLATLLTASFVGIVTYIYYPSRLEINLFISVMVLFVIFTHKENIRRLLKGEENKL